MITLDSIHSNFSSLSHITIPSWTYFCKSHTGQHMANSKYEYVREYERDEILLPNTWIVVRIDGRGFHKYVFPSQLYGVPGLAYLHFLVESHLIYSPLGFCKFIRPSRLLHRML